MPRTTIFLHPSMEHVDAIIIRTYVSSTYLRGSNCYWRVNGPQDHPNPCRPNLFKILNGLLHMWASLTYYRIRACLSFTLSHKIIIQRSSVLYVRQSIYNYKVSLIYKCNVELHSYIIYDSLQTCKISLQSHFDLNV